VAYFSGFFLFLFFLLLKNEKKKKNCLQTMAAKRENIVNELLKTEQTYVHGLHSLQHDFIRAVLNVDSIESDSLPRLVHSLTNLEKIHSRLVLHLAAEILKKGWNDETSCIGQLFIDFASLEQKEKQREEKEEEEEEEERQDDDNDDNDDDDVKVKEVKFKEDVAKEDDEDEEEDEAADDRIKSASSSSCLSEMRRLEEDRLELVALNVYVEYVNNFTQAVKEINVMKEKSRRFLNEVEQCVSWNGAYKGTAGLSGLLITPIQRVPRYCLMLGDLAKATDASHPDAAALRSAAAALDAMAAFVDSEKEREEMNRRLSTVIKSLDGDLSHLRQSVVQLRKSQLHSVTQKRKAHVWRAKVFKSPRWCCYCHSCLFDGKQFKGYRCSECNYSAHKACVVKVPAICGLLERDNDVLSTDRTMLMESEGVITYRTVLPADRSKHKRPVRSCLLLLFDDALMAVEPRGSKTVRHNLLCMIKWVSHATKRHIQFLAPPHSSTLTIMPPREADTLHEFQFASIKARDEWMMAVGQAVQMYDAVHKISEQYGSEQPRGAEERPRPSASSSSPMPTRRARRNSRDRRRGGAIVKPPPAAEVAAVSMSMPPAAATISGAGAGTAPARPPKSSARKKPARDFGLAPPPPSVPPRQRSASSGIATAAKPVVDKERSATALMTHNSSSAILDGQRPASADSASEAKQALGCNTDTHAPPSPSVRRMPEQDTPHPSAASPITAATALDDVDDGNNDNITPRRRERLRKRIGVLFPKDK
jgi:RhoGEF domain/Phorbol esters/diacylglycerol binding domain (C1 domain)